MIHERALATAAVGLVLSAHVFAAPDLSRYRDFQLGSDVAGVCAAAAIAATDVKTRHQRPAVLQDIEWRPSRWVSGSVTPSTDPVEQILFSFYNDQLFRVVVDYNHERTEGMTRADMIEGISAVYGASLPRTAGASRRAPSPLEAESGVVLARWGDGKHTVVLYETSAYGTAFRLVVTGSRLEALARTAETQAQRLDDREAPQREAARKQEDRDTALAAAAKARATNKRLFRT